ncbi:MAG: ATP-binding protein [Vicinamibacterales bacterium]
MLDWFVTNPNSTSLALTGVAAICGLAAGAAWHRRRRAAPDAALVVPSPPAAAVPAPPPAAARFAMLFEQCPLPLLLTTEAGGEVLEVNHALEGLAGRPAAALRGGSVFDLGGHDGPGDRLRHLEAIRSGAGRAVREFRMRTAAGRDLHLLAHTTRVTVDGRACLLTALTDTTATPRLDDRLLYAQRMEVIGRLSGGVAHGFNNLLTVMQGHLDALAGELPRTATAERRLEILRRSVAEASRITSGLLTFAGRNPVSATLVDVNTVLEDLAPMLAGTLGDGIEVAWDRARAPVPVMLGQPQLAQVLLNLALNAREAMPEGGRLAISTRRVDLGDAAAMPGPGTWVVVTVADSGHGMDDAVRRHMFEPFFTTKAGQGSGLGLSICLGIVEQAGGHMVADSSPGRGTTIHLYLPWAGADAVPGVQARALHLAGGPRPAILLVEDEPDVRDIVAEILRRAGHVVHAADGLTAVQALLGRGGLTLDLLLTDLVLPEGSGLDVATLVRAHHPDVPVLFMSGYSEAVFSGGERVEHLLPKPFAARTLLAKVDELMAPRQRAAAS